MDLASAGCAHHEQTPRAANRYITSAVRMHSAEPAAIAALSLASFALLLLARRRRAPRRFAGFDESVPESTRQARPPPSSQPPPSPQPT